jgi:hypothetical protein
MMVKTGPRKQGRLAGGAPTQHTYRGNVFGRTAYPSPVHGNTPGGLIDKRQQVDPASTTFGHPFDGGNYRSTASYKHIAARTGFNVIVQVNPLTHSVPEIGLHEHGAFFDRKLGTPIVKTQFGANHSGAQSDTSFHAQVKPTEPATLPKSALEGAKVMRTPSAPKSFHSTGNLWSSGNHSFIQGRPNTVNGQIGTGRWNTMKRSAV